MVSGFIKKTAYGNYQDFMTSKTLRRAIASVLSLAIVALRLQFGQLCNRTRKRTLRRLCIQNSTVGTRLCRAPISETFLILLAVAYSFQRHKGRRKWIIVKHQDNQTPTRVNHRFLSVMRIRLKTPTVLDDVTISQKR